MSLENRNKQHSVVERFLDKTGVSDLPLEERIAQMRNMSFEDFFSLLERLNGQLLDINIGERGKDDMSNGFLYDDTGMTTAYQVPENRRELLESFFDDMQENLSATSLERYAKKLEYAIVFSHIFNDGNGRTSRYAGRLLSQGQVDISDAETRLKSDRAVGAIAANKLAVFRIFQDILPEEYREISPIERPDDVRKYIYGIEKGFRAFNYAYPLKELALILAFPDKSPTELIINTKFYDGLRSDQELKDRYDAKYTELQDRLFWEVQKIIDEVPDDDIPNIDPVLHDRVEKLNQISR